MKILLIQTAFLGDVILTIPLVHSLKKDLKSKEVHVLIRPEAKSVFKNDPNVDKIILYDKRGTEKGLINLYKIIKKIRKNRYDVVISPHRSLRSALITFFSNAPKRIGFNINSLNFVYNKKVKYVKKFHEVDRNLSLIRPLYDGEINVDFNMYNSKQDEIKAKEIINKFCNINEASIIGIAASSQWNTKRWPPNYYKELIDMLISNGFYVILFGSEKDTGICNEIANNYDNKILNLCGSLTINESSEVMKYCKVIVSNDTGAMHIGSVSGVTTIAIYGPTLPEFGFYPYGVKNKIMQEKIYCRPCSIHGGQKCPEGHFRCMKNIHPKQVFEETIKLINDENNKT